MSDTEKERKQKAPSLLRSKRLAIGKDSVKFPDMTAAELAARHNCTEAQARRAVEQYNAGGLEVGRKRQPVAKIQRIITSDDVSTIVRRQAHYSAAALEAASFYNPDERILALNKLVATLVLIDKQELASHLKGADADFVAFLFRQFVRADLTNAEIVKLYHQYHEKWKSTAE